MDFSHEPPLTTELRSQAKRTFYLIVEHFDESHNSNDAPYNRPRLIRYTYEYARSEESQDNFLRAFFNAMALSMDGEEDLNFEDLSSPFLGFAEYLFDNFFLPMKASTKKTPQPSPAYHSAIQRTQGEETPTFIGTPDRVSALRGACLVRDRHRCVISRKFDLREAQIRHRRDGMNNARDDDGNLFLEQPGNFTVLEVAHILPHALMKAHAGSELNSSKSAALAILNMFDSGVVHLLQGTDIDRPRNAMTLSQLHHTLFGNFDIYFEPVPDQEPHTYCIRSFVPSYLLQDATFPITRTLYLSENRTIDPPSPRLLALHSAIAHILHLSAAGGYIDKLLRDMDDMDGTSVREDGSTDLDRFIRLRLGTWASA